MTFPRFEAAVRSSAEEVERRVGGFWTSAKVIAVLTVLAGSTFVGIAIAEGDLLAAVALIVLAAASHTWGRAVGESRVDELLEDLEGRLEAVRSTVEGSGP